MSHHLDLAVLGKNLSFDHEAAFVHHFSARRSGTKFKFETKRGDSRLLISIDGPLPFPPPPPPPSHATATPSQAPIFAYEEIMKIPLAGSTPRIKHDPARGMIMISIEGPKPQTNPRPSTNPLTLCLDTTTGDWKWSTDPSTGELALSAAVIAGPWPKPRLRSPGP